MPNAFTVGSSLTRGASVLAVAGAVALFAGCGGDSGESTGDGGGSAGSGDIATATTGVEIFKDSCASCHTLAAADAGGRIGPNLDNVKPDAGVVTSYVTNGEGSMPAFADRLTPEQITAVAEYVAEVAGQ